MTHHSVYMIGMLIIIGCSTQKEPQLNLLWNELELELQYGEVVTVDGRIKAVVVDVTKDEEGIWYGLCFLNENGLFGRQIPNGLIFTTCVEMLDATYLNESAIDLIETTDTLSHLLNPVNIGLIRPVTTLEDLIRSYEDGLKRREFERTPCDVDVLGPNPVRECYFKVDELN